MRTVNCWGRPSQTERLGPAFFVWGLFSFCAFFLISQSTQVSLSTHRWYGPEMCHLLPACETLERHTEAPTFPPPPIKKTGGGLGGSQEKAKFRSRSGNAHAQDRGFSRPELHKTLNEKRNPYKPSGGFPLRGLGSFPHFLSHQPVMSSKVLHF